MNKDEIVCRCEEVTYGEIVDAINSGCRTISEIRRKTRAGMGFCQGRSCRSIISKILAEKTGKKISEIEVEKIRPPEGAVKIKIFFGN